jgi:hypothetical protein
VARDIAWSSDFDNHLMLLSEMNQFQDELSGRLPQDRLRTSTALLDMAPSNTVMYAAIPNLTEHLSQAHQLMKERINENPGLSQLWDSQMGGRETAELIATIMDHVEKYGSQIGDEVVLTLQQSGREITAPVVLARLNNPARLREQLEDDLVRLQDRTGESPLILLPQPITEGTATREDGMMVSIRGDLLVVSPNLQAHQAVAADSGRFHGSPFHSSLAQVYRDGAGIVFGADLKKLIQMESDETSASTVLGIDNIQHLVVNRREIGEKTLTEAALTFAGKRAGMAAWLADPGPMGALEFISPDATAVGGFVVKNPSSLVEELFAMMPMEGRQDFQDKFREETGLDFLADVVAPLGGEVVFALDGPVLPKPAWKVVLEVYDPTAMQRTIQVAVEQLNNSDSSPEQVSLKQTEVKGQVYWAMVPSTGPQVHYTFLDGYMIVAPRRVFLDRAIRYRDSGLTLPSSGRFADLLPEDGRMNFSAMVYQNLGAILGPLVNSASGMTQNLAPEHKAGLQQLVENMEPSLYLVFGEKDRIVFTGSDRTGLLGNDFGNLFNLGSILKLGELMEQTEREPAEPVYDGGSGGDV